MIKIVQVCAFAMIAPAAYAAGYAPGDIGRIAPAATLVQLRGPGAPCVADGHCRSFNCEPSLDLSWYCVEESARCAMKGTGGFKIGEQIRANNQCYECTPGMGWPVSYTHLTLPTTERV